MPFWQLSSYIDTAEKAGLAAAGYRLQYYQLLAQPFFLVAMVLLAASVSLRFFRFGRRAEDRLGRHRSRLSALRHGEGHRRLEQGRPDGADDGGGLPPAVGGVTGFIALLYQEDG